MKQAIIDAKNKLVEQCSQMGLTFDQQSQIEELAHAIAKAGDYDKRLEVREWKANRNIPPQIFLDLDVNDLNYTGDTVTTILIKKGDKVARINLTIAENNGKVKASITTDGPNRQTQKIVNAIFGWEQDPNDPKAVEYPKGDERRRTPA